MRLSEQKEKEAYKLRMGKPPFYLQVFSLTALSGAFFQAATSSWIGLGIGSSWDVLLRGTGSCVSITCNMGQATNCPALVCNSLGISLDKQVVADCLSIVPLVVCLRTSLHIWVAKALSITLKGSTRRWALLSWSALLGVVWFYTAMLTLRLIHSGGVHIHLDVAKSLIWTPIMVLFAGTCVRAAIRLRIDCIGTCRKSGKHRIPSSKCRVKGIRFRYLFMCGLIMSAKAVEIDNTIKHADVMDPRSHDWSKGQFGHFSETESSDESRLVNQGELQESTQCDSEPSSSQGLVPDTAVCEQAGRRHFRACDSSANRSDGHPSLAYTEEGSALPEASFLPSNERGYLSRPCEGRRLSTVDQHDQEGHCRPSTKPSSDISNRSIPDLCNGVDAGRTVLGDFVLNSGSQAPFPVERGPIVNKRARRGDSSCFDDRPMSVKVWFAPHRSCNIVAKDVTLRPQHFGNIQEEVCRVWSDEIPLELCSFRTISPQPDEQTYGQFLHVVVFSTSSSAAVLVRQTSSHSDYFCACALSPFYPVRKRHEIELQRFWKIGELVQVKTHRHGNICTHTTWRADAHSGTSVDHGADSKAEVMSLMQTTAEQRETIAGARYAHAVHHQQAYHGVANFALQNFVKNDDLRRWIEALPFYEASEVFILAIWRMEPGRAVTMDCDRIRLNEGNWARTFRTYWKVGDIYKTPKLAAVEPQPEPISHRDFQQIHIIAVEHRHLPSGHMVHLFEVYATVDRQVGTGRTFLARRAAEIPRDLTVGRLPEILGFPAVGAQVFATVTIREGWQQAVFRDRQVLTIPEFSLVEIIFVLQDNECFANFYQKPTKSLDDPSQDHDETVQQTEERQTLLHERETESSVFMQVQAHPRTAADIEIERCFDPVRTPIRLYTGVESSWRLWNHFVHDRAWTRQREDEVSAWILVEAAFVQSLPITLFTSRRGSRTWNDPLGLWKALGGRGDPIVLMAFPTPANVVRPEDHLLFVPFESYDRGERVFLVDIVNRNQKPTPILERVAVRAYDITPKILATKLQHSCDGCSVQCGGCRKFIRFSQDQEIRCRTGSYAVLDITTPEEEKASSSQPKDLGKPECTSSLEGDEMRLFQFEPPPRENTHRDSERYFWVRNTIVYQPALLLAVLVAGQQMVGHWPLIVVHYQGMPNEIRSFGFQNHERVNLDTFRINFRERYAEHFQTEAMVSVGPVDVEQLQHFRFPLHEIDVTAFQSRIPLDKRPTLICVRFNDESPPVTPRAVILDRMVSRQDVIVSASLVTLCTTRQYKCLVPTSSGRTIGETPNRIESWQRVYVDVRRVDEDEREKDQDGVCIPFGRTVEQYPEADTEEAAMMQTPTDNGPVQDFLARYTFSVADRFLGPRPDRHVWLSTYCHLWQDRARPGRNHRPIVVARDARVLDQIARTWSPPVLRSQMEVIPVRPMPNIGAGPRPTVIVTDHDDEHFVPILFDYTSDDRTFIGTGLVGCHRGFPEVHMLFDLLIPGNACRTTTSCLIRAHGRHFVPGQTVMLFAGIFVQLDEQDLNEATTENATSTEYGHAQSQSSTTGISSNASVQPFSSISETEAFRVYSELSFPILAGPFFDWNEEGQLYVIGHQVASDTVLLLFQQIAEQRTDFPQFQHLMNTRPTGDGVLPNGNLLVIVTVNREWQEAKFVYFTDLSSDPAVAFGVIRQSLLEEFPVHVSLAFWLVHPEILPEEQDQASNVYVLVDYDCPEDEKGVAVLIRDPEETEIDRQAIRVRSYMTNLLLFIQIGKTVKCTSDDFECSVEYEGRPLPPGAYWPTTHGMKLIVHILDKTTVKERQASESNCRRTGTFRSGLSISRTEDFHDYASLMHLFSTQEMMVTEREISMSPDASSSYHGTLVLFPEQEGDLLRSYIHDRKGGISHDVFTVYVWMLYMPHVQVVHIAQRCPMFRARSYTEALRRLWLVTYPLQPLAVTLIHPDLQPLSLRAVPLDIVVVPEGDLSSSRRVYVIDVVGMPLPRRLALFATDTTTVEQLAALAGARLICDLPETECVLKHEAPEHRREWKCTDVVDVSHGTSLVLWILSRYRQPAANIQLSTDECGFMQQPMYSTTEQIELPYFQEAVQIGHMHVWVHDTAKQEVVQSQHRRVPWSWPKTNREIRNLVWTDKDQTRKWDRCLVYPLPILRGTRQPTIIFFPVHPTEHWPVLIEIDSEHILDLVTMVLPACNAPYSVDFLFQQVLPDNACRATSRCEAQMNGATYQFWVDIPVQAGSYIELIETVLSPESTTTTCNTTLEEIEESSFTEDEELDLTQLDLRMFRYVRCPETGRPLSTRLHQEGLTDLGLHWQAFEEDMFQHTTWHRTQAFQAEAQAMAPLEERQSKVWLLWFTESEDHRRMNVQWQDEWSYQVGLGQARAEIRLMLWDEVPPGRVYVLGTAHPQPTTRQQNGRDDLYIVGQPEDDREVAVLLVVNYLRSQIDRFLIRATKTGLFSSRERILADTVMTGMCEAVVCVVSANAQEWPPLVQFPVTVGLRIDIEIRFDEAPLTCDTETEQNAGEHVDISSQATGDDEGDSSSLFCTSSYSGVNTATPRDQEERAKSKLPTLTEGHSLPIDEPWGNTATHRLHRFDTFAKDVDTSSFMQSYERLFMDSGNSPTSPDRLQRCISDRLAWLEPLRLDPKEMQRAWEFPGIDYIQHHFSRQGLTSPSFKMEGWIFRDFHQQEGTPFF